MAYLPCNGISTPASSTMPSRIIPKGSSPWTPAARGLSTGRWRGLLCWAKIRLDFVNGACMLYILLFWDLFSLFSLSPPRSPPICFFSYLSYHIHRMETEPLEGIYPDFGKDRLLCTTWNMGRCHSKLLL